MLCIIKGQSQEVCLYNKWTVSGGGVLVQERDSIRRTLSNKGTVSGEALVQLKGQSHEEFSKIE